VSLRQRGYVALALLAALGAAVQVNEMRSPFIYGAGREAAGLSRAEVRTVLQSLRERHIEHVYNGEPMLQWVLMFESHEEIIGRGANPNDRVPDYARRVDQAWVQGLPVALVVRSEGELQMVPNPQPAFIEAHFAPAIPLRSSPGAIGRQG
jgi:hypothetical protein